MLENLFLVGVNIFFDNGISLFLTFALLGSAFTFLAHVAFPNVLFGEVFDFNVLGADIDVGTCLTNLSP